MKNFKLVRLLLISTVLGSVGLAQMKARVSGPVVMFMGPPGSGKSTQAAAAAKALKLPLVAVDDLIKANPAVFEKIRATGVSGIEPQTDPVLNRLFEGRLEKGDLAHGMILDGYPSTKDHADYLTRLVSEGVLPKPLAIELQIPDATVLERTEKVQKETRASVEQRLKDYHREMDMVRLYFPSAEIVGIDGTQPIKTVEKEVHGLLKKRLKR